MLIDTVSANKFEKALAGQPVGRPPALRNSMNARQVTAENDAGESLPSNMVESKL